MSLLEVEILLFIGLKAIDRRNISAIFPLQQISVQMAYPQNG
jgi:hypothetical protein